MGHLRKSQILFIIVTLTISLLLPLVINTKSETDFYFWTYEQQTIDSGIIANVRVLYMQDLEKDVISEIILDINVRDNSRDYPDSSLVVGNVTVQVERVEFYSYDSIEDRYVESYNTFYNEKTTVDTTQFILTVDIKFSFEIEGIENPVTFEIHTTLMNTSYISYFLIFLVILFIALIQLGVLKSGILIFQKRVDNFHVIYLRNLVLTVILLLISGKEILSTQFYYKYFILEEKHVVSLLTGLSHIFVYFLIPTLIELKYHSYQKDGDKDAAIYARSEDYWRFTKTAVIVMGILIFIFDELIYRETKVYLFIALGYLIIVGLMARREKIKFDKI